MGNLIPFDLDKFKTGQKARRKDTLEGKPFSYRFTTVDGKIAVESISGRVGVYDIENLNLCAVMVSRHQHLIDAYNQEDTWQYQAGDNSK